MIVEYSREHNSLIFASTENLCVDLLWQLEFIHMFNTCPIIICVTWRHKECEWFGRYLTVVKVQLQRLENGSSNNGNHYYVPCLLFNWRKYTIQLITGWKQCGFSNIDNGERGFCCQFGVLTSCILIRKLTTEIAHSRPIIARDIAPCIVQQCFMQLLNGGYCNLLTDL